MSNHQRMARRGARAAEGWAGACWRPRRRSRPAGESRARRVADAPLSGLRTTRRDLGRHDRPASPAPRTVLYIEDSAVFVAFVERTLAARPDVRLVVAPDGERGLRLAGSVCPWLILLDRHLPDLDGDEVLARLRAGTATRDVPVVMVTADAAPGDIERVLAAGASGWLVKPFQPDALLAIIDGGADPTPRADAVVAGDALVDERVLVNLQRLVAASPGAKLDALLAVFIRESRARVAQLRTALDATDRRGVVQAAHSVAGSSASFGAMRMAAAGRQLELLGRTGDLAGAAAVLDRLEADLERTATALGAALA